MVDRIPATTPNVANDIFIQDGDGRGFQSCSPGQAATYVSADFMNGLMMEVHNAIRASGQEPLAYDAANISTVSQLAFAINSAQYRWIPACDFNVDSGDGANPSKKEEVNGLVCHTMENGQVFWLNHIPLANGFNHNLQLRAQMKTVGTGTIGLKVESRIIGNGTDLTNTSFTETVTTDLIAVPSSNGEAFEITAPNIISASNVSSHSMYANLKITRVASSGTDNLGDLSVIAGRVTL